MERIERIYRGSYEAALAELERLLDGVQNEHFSYPWLMPDNWLIKDGDGNVCGWLSLRQGIAPETFAVSADARAGWGEHVVRTFLADLERMGAKANMTERQEIISRMWSSNTLEDIAEAADCSVSTVQREAKKINLPQKRVTRK